MILIRHRVNQVADIENWTGSLTVGVEIDVRSDVHRTGFLHLAHDPWVTGSDLEDWLRAWTAKGFVGPVIFNVKEDGLEARVIEVAERHGLMNFFFLDSAIPTMVRMTKAGESRFAIRVSRFEGTRLAHELKDRAKWLWLDCFGGEPYLPTDLQELKSHYHICLVAPELQGGSADDQTRFAAVAAQCDAVCTKSSSWSFHAR